MDPPANLYVPDLFYIECTNILLKYTRRFGRSMEDSRADLVDLGYRTLADALAGCRYPGCAWPAPKDARCT